MLSEKVSILNNRKRKSLEKDCDGFGKSQVDGSSFLQITLCLNEVQSILKENPCQNYDF